MSADFKKAEFEMLEAFYLAWEDLHSLPPDDLHRKKKEAAAEILVSHAHTLRRMRDNKPRLLVPSFTRH